MLKKLVQGPRVLLLDIETAPILGYVWSIWEQNVGLNQIKQDWYILSWGAKWLNEPKVLYQDQRHAKNLENDVKLLKGIWKLLDEADIVITQNGKSFDIKKLNARFIINGMLPPSSFKHIDTLRIAKSKFGFTSNKLEYLSDRLNTKYKKLKHNEFAGFELWKECLAGNPAAWKCMEKYNKHDVLSLEELYKRLAPWDSSISFDLYTDSVEFRCNCGSTDIVRNGYAYTSLGKYQRYSCSKCGAETKGRNNLFSKEKKLSLRAKSS